MALSGGQKQRLAIAGALAAQKDIIFYDEPTSGLDYRNMERVAENIRRLSEMGKTQFVITHDQSLWRNAATDSCSLRTAKLPARAFGRQKHSSKSEHIL